MSRSFIIGFSRPRGWFKPFAWLIMLFERAPYSHVYIKTYSATADLWLVYQASGSQVNFMGQKHFEKHAKIVREFEFLMGDFAYKNYLKWTIQNAGNSYGLKTVLGILIARMLKLHRNPLEDGNNSQYCAELAAKALHDFMGIKLAPYQFELIGPKGIYAICEELKRGEINGNAGT